MVKQAASQRMDSDSHLKNYLNQQAEKFREVYLWLQEAMPKSFFDEIGAEVVPFVVQGLMAFDLQEHFYQINLKYSCVIIAPNTLEAESLILKKLSSQAIKNYRTFVSLSDPNFSSTRECLRIVIAYFDQESCFLTASKGDLEIDIPTFSELLKIESQELECLKTQIHPGFRQWGKDRLKKVLDLYSKAKNSDYCQVHAELKREDDDSKSYIELSFAWKNVPRADFLLRLAHCLQRWRLLPKGSVASFIDPVSPQSVLLFSCDLMYRGQTIDEFKLNDFLQELSLLKFISDNDDFDTIYNQRSLLSYQMTHFLRCASRLIHQLLVHEDPNFYSLAHIQESLCRHPELTVRLCNLFTLKFDPQRVDVAAYEAQRQELSYDIDRLDTSQPHNDILRRNVLKQALHFIDHTLKTNFFCAQKSAFSFRIDPQILDKGLPIMRQKFSVIPYAIFYIFGNSSFGFHIRFKDLARGGLRTVSLTDKEQVQSEADSVFSECYHLSLTQDKKNKDIPEGGAKGILFLEVSPAIQFELEQYQKTAVYLPKPEAVTLIEQFKLQSRNEHLYASQRAFIESLLDLVNCDHAGVLKVKGIVDYYQRPEYLYLGPDENMHTHMIEWIADISRKVGYKCGGAFISSKPGAGINHKQYGVTSHGVNVCMHEVLRELGIDPSKQAFTVKMTGGPDGDVAGNQIVNLYRCYPDTAKLVALTDVSGTIFDPQGLDLQELVSLFERALPIRCYSAAKLNDGGFLIDKWNRKEEGPLVNQILRMKKINGVLQEEWLTTSQANELLRNSVHRTKADIFIPGGGRPRTLDESNISVFFDEENVPTAKGIVEGANLYLSSQARALLEEKGVVIIKDSSANKGGVICSSFEVLAGLTLTDEQFLQNKEVIVKEILERIASCASKEVSLILKTRREQGLHCTEISEKISEKINDINKTLLHALESEDLASTSNGPKMQCFIDYALPILKNQFLNQLVREVPDVHKKAIIACAIASENVYQKGINWNPSQEQILDLLRGT